MLSKLPNKPPVKPFSSLLNNDFLGLLDSESESEPEFSESSFFVIFSFVLSGIISSIFPDGCSRFLPKYFSDFFSCSFKSLFLK